MFSSRAPLPWYATRLTKLRAMSSREVVQRVRYAAYCRRERRQHARGVLARPDRLHRALVPALRERNDWRERLVAGRHAKGDAFFAGTTDVDSMRALFEREYSNERTAAIESADRVVAGDIHFFGQAFRLRSPMAWNRDPVTGAEWPRRYHRDVPIHDSTSPFGDVKYVWELNRHQFLIDLGRASFLTGDPRYSDAARTLIADWIADNPYATGVNWSCALEPAFRALSWLWTYYLCRDQLEREPDHHLLWLTALYDHGRFLHRHLEHYSSPFNHLIGEAAALYLLGVLFPEFHEAAAWRRRGRRVLERRLDGQFYADGGTFEQSTFYHHATLGFYLLAAVLGRRHGEELSDRVWQAIEHAIAFSMALVQPDGTTPRIGGADDGKPLRMEHRPLWDFRHMQAIGAALFGRSDFKAAAGRFHEDALWLLGHDGLDRFQRIAAECPREPSLALPASGYYVLRSDWSPAADYVCVDCGEQAAGLRTDAVPSSVHGHADCLSVIVRIGGRPVLDDAGLFCYNGDARWVSHFRGTAAHNTARIDGRDQARHLGKMAWSHSYVAKPEAWSVGSHGAAFLGSHDGYARLGGDTIHRRLVWLRPGGYLVIYDEFECRREHDVELNFQFTPGAFQFDGPWSASFDDVALVWTGSIELRADVQCGGPEPHHGWVAPSLGVRTAAPRLTLLGRIGPVPSAVLTVFAPKAPATRVDILASAVPDATGHIVKIVGPEFEDYVGAPSIARHSLLGATDAPVAVWRFRDGRQVEALQIGGSYVRDATGIPARGADRSQA